MPQETQEIRDLRRQMRDGRTPLLEAIREAYSPYLLARKGLERKIVRYVNNSVCSIARLPLASRSYATQRKIPTAAAKRCWYSTER